MNAERCCACGREFSDGVYYVDRCRVCASCHRDASQEQQAEPRFNAMGVLVLMAGLLAVVGLVRLIVL